MSTDHRRFYVISYDIPSDRRRTRVAKELLGYGDRIQYSVFIVILRPAKLHRLRDALKRLIRASEDSIAIFDLGPFNESDPRKQLTFIGRTREATATDIIVI